MACSGGIARPDGGLTHVVRAGGGWAARPVPLEPGARARLLAAAGDAAVVAYAGPPPAPEPDPRTGPSPAGGCRLALVDLRTDTAAPAPLVCHAGETITGVALERTPDGPGAYLALAGPQGGRGAAAPALGRRVC
jgi:hypothetical protein